jgi:hypothetical protein
MSAVNDGGPAFPVPNDANVNGQEGMSLRAYIAAHRPAPADMHFKVATAFTGRPQPERGEFPAGDSGIAPFTFACQLWWAEAEAAYSVAQADALIAALEKKP